MAAIPGTLKRGMVFVAVALTTAGIGILPRRTVLAGQQQAKGPGIDRYGDPLPAGALARLGTLRFRAYTATLSPDGKLLATSWYRQVRLLNARTGKLFHAIVEPESVSSLVFAPDGKSLAGVGGDNVIRVWDVANGALQHRLEGPRYDRRNERHLPPPLRFAAPAFSADGKFLTAGNDGPGEGLSLYVWELKTGLWNSPFSGLQKHRVRATLSPDGRVLATWGQDAPYAKKRDLDLERIVQLWDVAGGRELRRLKTRDQSLLVTSVAFSPDGKILAIAAGRSTVELWAADGGKLLHRLTGRPSRDGIVSFSPDCKTLALAGRDGTVQLWQAGTWKRLAVGEGPPGEPAGLAFLPGGKVLVAATDGLAASLWEVTSGKLLTPSERHYHVVTAVAFAPGGKRLWSASTDGMICEWNLGTGRQVRHHYLQDEASLRLGTPQRYQYISLSLDGRHVGSVGEDDTGVRLWETASGKLAALFPECRMGGLGNVAFSADGTTLAGIDMDVAVHVWDVKRRRERQCLNSEAKEHFAKRGVFLGRTEAWVALAPDGRRVAATAVARNFDASFHEVVVWDITSGKMMAFIPYEILAGLAFSPDGQALALTSYQQIRLRELTADKVLRRLEPPQGTAYAPTFSPDGRTLGAACAVSQPGGGAENTLAVWELATGEIRCRLRGHDGMVGSLAFSPDGSTLVSGGADTTVLLWDVTGRSLYAGVAPRPADALWADLASAKAERGFRAEGELLADPAAALALFRERLRPARVEDFDVAGIRRLVADLDDRRYAVRAKAARAVQEWGKAAVPLLRERLRQGPSLEQRRRIEAVLPELVKALPRPEELRGLRAVEVLERIGTPAVRPLLERLAGGAPGAPLTTESRQALERLRHRP